LDETHANHGQGKLPDVKPPIRILIPDLEEFFGKLDVLLSLVEFLEVFEVEP
jgi:hypothetical protein